MPTAAPRPCLKAGCTALAKDGYCEAHRAELSAARERSRGSSATRGYDRRWRRARIAFLRAHPLCAEHERNGMIVPATVVDHIVPHKGDMALFWSSENWRPLCKACHDTKTVKDGRWG